MVTPFGFCMRAPQLLGQSFDTVSKALSLAASSALLLCRPSSSCFCFRAFSSWALLFSASLHFRASSSRVLCSCACSCFWASWFRILFRFSASSVLFCRLRSRSSSFLANFPASSRSLYSWSFSRRVIPPMIMFRLPLPNKLLNLLRIDLVSDGSIFPLPLVVVVASRLSNSRQVRPSCHGAWWVKQVLPRQLVHIIRGFSRPSKCSCPEPHPAVHQQKLGSSLSPLRASNLSYLVNVSGFAYCCIDAYGSAPRHSGQVKYLGLLDSNCDVRCVARQLRQHWVSWLHTGDMGDLGKPLRGMFSIQMMHSISSAKCWDIRYLWYEVRLASHT